MIRNRANIVLYSVFFILFSSIIFLGVVIKNGFSFRTAAVRPEVHKSSKKILASYNKSTFIQFLLTRIRKANVTIASQRDELKKYYRTWQFNGSLTDKQKKWLVKLAKNYHMKTFSVTRSSDWESLLKRVDVVPAGLVLAQAINESAWGQSRFAKQGNNFFGQYCYVNGCGMIPYERPYDANFEVKRFSSALAAVKGYMYNLNTNNNYQNFRTQRMRLRKEHQTLSSIMLADALQNYSTRGQGYVNSLDNLIDTFNLSRFDKA